MARDNQNPLNSTNVHASSPSCRVDHVMPHNSMGLTALSAGMLFTQDVAKLGAGDGGGMITASDHYGLSIVFTK